MPTFPDPIPADAELVAEPMAHEDLALDRLAEFLRGKENVASTLQALTESAQELETALRELSYYRRIDNAFGQLLDDIGATVGQPRGPLGDEAYRMYLRARIKTNASSGTVSELLEIFALILGPNSGVELLDEPPASFAIRIATIEIDEVTQGALIAFMRAARAAGVRGVLIWTPDLDMFEFDNPDTGFDDGGALGGAAVS
jgi:hypothetical protein